MQNKIYWISVTDYLLKAKIKSIKYALKNPIWYLKALREYFK
jgi:hypothetical protein